MGQLLKKFNFEQEDDRSAPYYFIEIDFGSPLFDCAMDLRNRLLRIPLGLEFEKKDIEKEWKELHFGVMTTENQLAACLTLRPLPNGVYKMRQVAVDQIYQSKGIGKLLVLGSENYCRQIGAKRIELNARDTAIPFYEKLDYQVVGSTFTEVGIEHIKMIRNLT